MRAGQRKCELLLGRGKTRMSVIEHDAADFDVHLAADAEFAHSIGECMDRDDQNRPPSLKVQGPWFVNSSQPQVGRFRPDLRTEVMVRRYINGWSDPFVDAGLQNE